jgi:hypothetical protein
MGHPQVADGKNGLYLWRVGANILNKQSRTADKGWSYVTRIGLRTGHHSNMLRIITKTSVLNCLGGLKDVRTGD